jgi:hypothetical protein
MSVVETDAVNGFYPDLHSSQNVCCLTGNIPKSGEVKFPLCDLADQRWWLALPLSGGRPRR